MDEMKIQSNRIFNKFYGDIVGFVDLGDPMTNFANLTEEDAMASHALAFLVRGLFTEPETCHCIFLQEMSLLSR